LASGKLALDKGNPTNELHNTLPNKGNNFVPSLDDKPKKEQRFFANRSNDD
jgi:hypothetical protein